MTEEAAIKHSKLPITRSRIVNDLHELGVRAGDKIIVHTSMSKIGWVCGGARTVIEALQEAVTETGLLVMPTHSADVSDPAEWGNPAVPRSWYRAIYQEMPAFDPMKTPTLGMGPVAELFRTCPGVQRSNHPIYSFAAWGNMKASAVGNHGLNDGLGMRSPLGEIYKNHGRIVLIGVSYRKNTSMHLGEIMSGRLQKTKRMSPIDVNGQRKWLRYWDWDYHEETFEKIGRLFEQTAAASSAIRKGLIGQACSLLLDQKMIVDFTAAYLKTCHQTILQ